MGRISLFNGGLNKTADSHLIQANQGPEYDNINHVRGSLSPISDKVQAVSGANKWGHKFSQNDQWYFSPDPKDWVEFQEVLYVGNRDGQSSKINAAGEEYRLGVAAPTIQPNIAATSYEFSDVTDATLFALGSIFGGPPPGDIPANLDLEYRIISENSASQFSSGILYDVSTGSVINNAVYINLVEETFPFAVNIYRKWTDGQWHLVNRTLKTASLTTIIDSVYDISAGAILNEATLGSVGRVNGTEIQYAMTFYNSNDGSESVPLLITPKVTVVDGIVEFTNLEVSGDPQVDEKKLYRIGGAITTFTLVTTLPNATTVYTDDAADDELPGSLLQSTSNFPAPDNLYWLTEAYAMLFAAKNDKLYFTPIAQPNSWPQTNFLDFPDRITGIAKTPIGLLVFNKHETWLITGTGPLSLAQQSLSRSQGCINGDTVVNVQGAAYWVSTDGVCISNGGSVVIQTRARLDKSYFIPTTNALVYDDQYYLQFDNNKTFIMDLQRESFRRSIYAIDNILTDRDVLYGHSGGYLHELEASDDLLEMRYLSPEFIGLGLTTQKAYKNIYVQSDGDLDVRILINGVEVKQINVTGFDNHQLKIPTEKTRGFKIQFDIRGTGTVYEIQWEDGNVNQ